MYLIMKFYSVHVLILILALATVMDSNNATASSGFTSPSMGFSLIDSNATEAGITRNVQTGSMAIMNKTQLEQSSYVGGDMVKGFEALNYSTTSINVLIPKLSCFEEIFSVSSRYSVNPVSSPIDFYSSLNSSSIAVVMESALAGLTDMELSEFVTNLVRWAEQGNLLVLNDMRSLDEDICRILGISFLETKVSNTSTYQVKFKSPSPLTHNRVYRELELDVIPTCFLVVNPQISEAVASIEEQELPCVVLSTLGKGFVFTIGFNAGSIKIPGLPTFRGVLENLFEMYGSVHFYLCTDSLSVANPSSPHLHAMQGNESILVEMREVISSLSSLGFNAFGSNLLYADHNGGYFGYASFHGGLQSFVRIFSSFISIAYDDTPHIILSNTTRIPSSCSDVFSKIDPLPVTTLFWPAGWNPPDVPYYHLAPTKQYSHDMGSDLWTPQSVEEVIRADDARNLGPAGDGVKVVMVDTGFSRNRISDPNNPDYPTELGYHPYYEEYWRYKDLMEFQYAGHWAGGYNPDEDTYGHGTGIASNLFAVSPDIEFHFVPYWDTVDAFRVILEDIEPDVVTCSWGWAGEDIPAIPALQDQIRQLAENGVIVVFSGGNGAYDRTWPSSEPCVVSVGGAYVDSSGGLEASNYASSGREPAFNGRVVPDVCGIVGQQPYGVLIEMPTEPESTMDQKLSQECLDGTGYSDGWCVFSGTSSAAPQVAGLAALMKELEPDLNVGRFKHIVMTTCTDIVTGQSYDEDVAEKGFDKATGAGLIDCYRAIKTMLEYSSSGIYEAKTEPDGKFMNFYSFTGPHGPSYHADTAGSTQSGYYFFGYLVSRDGAVMTRQYDASAGWFRIAGWFRQYDTFTPSLQPGRRYLDMYVLSVDGNQLIKAVRILDHDDGTNWIYVNAIVTDLPEYGMVRVAFGRYDCWSTDWQLTAEWANVNIYSYDQWWPDTIYDGRYYRWGSSIAPESHLGNTCRIDTIGSSEYSYYFFGYASDYNPYLGPNTKISIAGWFRQDDTFDSDLQEGRRYLDLYVIDRLSQPWAVKATFRILDYYDGTDWVHRRLVFQMPSNLPADYYYIAIGRYDCWMYDWHLTGEWNNIQLVVGPSF